MKRRHFIRTGLQFGIALSSLEGLALTNWLSNPYDELIGKGKPELVGAEIKFRKEAYEAFASMRERASRDDIDIRPVSAYRSFRRQKQIWERKYRSYRARGLDPMECIEEIIRYSTVPGTSRHHWGTDIDIVEGSRMNEVSSLLVPSNFDMGNPFYDLGQWLTENASNFGYHLVYTNDPDRKGFNYEPWHFSYKPLSLKFLEQFLELDLLEILREEQYAGTPFFNEAFIKKYKEEHILDINPVLLKG